MLYCMIYKSVHLLDTITCVCVCVCLRRIDIFYSHNWRKLCNQCIRVRINLEDSFSFSFFFFLIFNFNKNVQTAYIYSFFITIKIVIRRFKFVKWNIMVLIPLNLYTHLISKHTYISTYYWIFLISQKRLKKKKNTLRNNFPRKKKGQKIKTFTTRTYDFSTLFFWLVDDDDEDGNGFK